MQSNRKVFQEMREQEAFENPHGYERHEEAKPVQLSALEMRANAYIDKVNHNKYKQYNFTAEQWEKLKDRKGLDVDLNPIVYGPHPLTEFQKLHHIAECSAETKSNNLKSIEDGFKKLRKKS